MRVINYKLIEYLDRDGVWLFDGQIRWFEKLVNIKEDFYVPMEKESIPVKDK